MARRPSRHSLSTGILIVLLAGVLVGQTLGASATHLPADKVVASGDAVVEVPVTGIVELSEVVFKASKPTDLMIHYTLECSILTRLENQGGPGVDQSTGSAAGRIRVWIEMDDKVVAINQISENPQPNDPPEIGDDIDKVTFCNNEQEFTVTDAEEDENNTGGGDGTDTYNQYLKTKTANAFNWIVLNTGGWGGSNNGIHRIEVMAEFDEYKPATSPDGTGEAAGFVGNRMLIVEPTKMSNHAVV